MAFLFFFCKPKSAYDLRISDWSSDVCSSDLCDRGGGRSTAAFDRGRRARDQREESRRRRSGAGVSTTSAGSTVMPAMPPPMTRMSATSIMRLLPRHGHDLHAGRHLEEVRRLRPALEVARSEEHTAELPSLRRI